jgi:hypothetical protein
MTAALVFSFLVDFVSFARVLLRAGVLLVAFAFEADDFF